MVYVPCARLTCCCPLVSDSLPVGEGRGGEGGEGRRGLLAPVQS